MKRIQNVPRGFKSVAIWKKTTANIGGKQNKATWIMNLPCTDPSTSVDWQIFSAIETTNTPPNTLENSTA